MNTTQEDLDRIHFYLLDEMFPTVGEAFEQECAQDAFQAPTTANCYL